ncbi:MAG: FMN-binding negative transcriptional regulator [Gammaproteobacteria bacterium]|nr:FMN-binding negative transcriptional regulator [Gammaproteobacteria bacterium]NND60378.1 FMN-binding negative transcriptional regulator [Gammaproteobacteria bacterium]
MYLPRSFRVQDKNRLAAFMRRYSFATMVTPAAGDVAITHLPVLLDGGDEQWTVRGHVARANPHWQALPGARTTLVFHGPHSYISPGWYDDHNEVPTWNYAVVHAHGRARLIEDSNALDRLVDEAIDQYEELHDSPWNRRLAPENRKRQLEYIVGFEIAIDQLEGKFKLGQNRSVSDQQSMRLALSESGDDDSRALAAFIESFARE